MICFGMRKWPVRHGVFPLVVFVLLGVLLSPELVSAKERQGRSKKCKYYKSRVRWGACDPTVHVKTKVASLIRSKSKSDCPKTKTYTKPCNLESITYNGCEYIQVSDWSECAKDTNTKTRTLELRSGSTSFCDNTRLESRECGIEDDKEHKDDTRASRHGKKGEKKEKRKKKKKHKNKKKKKKRRKKHKTVLRNGCLYRKGSWEPCDEKTGLQVMKSKLKKKTDLTKCEAVFIVTRQCDPKSKRKGLKLFGKKNRGGRGKKRNKNSKRNKKKDKKKNAKRAKKMKQENNELSQIPPRLTELHVVPYTNFVLASWKSPQDEETGRPVPVDGYQIGYGRGFPDVHTIAVNASVLSYRIENLEPGGEYVISIRAVNQVGVGQALYDTVMTRDEDKGGESSPLLPPVGVVSRVLSAKSINVSWVDLSIKGQQLPVGRRYFLRYRQLNHLSKTLSVYNIRFKILPTKDAYLVVSDLLPFTKYEFAVLTSSGAKNSTWSFMVWNITDQDVPADAPTDLTYIIDPDSPRQVTLSWQPPTRPNGIITGYDISYHTSLAEEPSMETKLSVEGNKLSKTLTSLTPGVPYDLSVRARNVKGLGPYRTIRKYTLPEDPAPVPATLNVTRVEEDPTAVKLTWDIPAQVDVDIVGFVILYTFDSKSSLVHWKVESRTGKDLRTAIMDNLNPSTRYAFKLQTHTSTGFGPESNMVTQETGPLRANKTDSVGPPTNLRIKVLSATAAVASWQDPQAASGLELKMPNPNPVYQLRYRSLESDPGPYTEVTVYFPSFYLNDLSPLTQYEFSVCALKCEEMAQWTQPVLKTTFAVDFSQHPLKVEVKGQTNSPYIAVLSWQPHSDANFKEYVVMYTTDPSKPHKHWVQKSAVGLEVNQEVFYDLNPDIIYFFFVQAMTDVGFGPRSKVVSYTTPSNKTSSSLPHPQKLQAIMVSATSAVLTWQDPGSHAMHQTEGKDRKKPQTVRTCTIRYKTLGKRSSGYKFLTTPSQSLFMVTLKPATEYEFSVRVNYEGQHSVWSPPVTNRTFESAPASPPRNISVAMDNNDPTSIMLSWKPPQLPNGDVIGYIVFYTTNHKLSIRKVSVESVSGDKLSHRISSLKPHKTYYFKMRAHNRKGHSPLSETTVYKTPKVIGPPPHLTSVEPQTGNPYNAVVQWEPPANKKRKIQYYTLTYNTEDGRDRVVERINGEDRETVVQNLHASTTYHLTLQAFYTKGAGPHSSIAKYSIPKELIEKSKRI